jgi:transposase-like protein
VHRWVIKLVPLFEKTFRKHKRPVGKIWRMDETYVKVSGDWKYLYRAVDKAGQTVDFLLRAHRLGGDNDYVRPSDIHLGRW